MGLYQVRILPYIGAEVSDLQMPKMWSNGADGKRGRVMKEFEDRKEFEKIFESVRNNIKEQIALKGVSMKGSAKGTALSEIISVFDEELELGIAEELRKGRGLIRAYYRKYNEVESLEIKRRENEQKLEAQQKLVNTVSLLTDETLKNAIVAYEALSDRRGRSDAKEIVIAYINAKGREDLTDIIEQTERSVR